MSRKSSRTEIGDLYYFKSVSVSGETNIEADTVDDTLTFTEGHHRVNLTTTPASDALTIGLLDHAVTSKSGAYTLTSSDDVVICDTSGADFSLTLPTAVGIGGKRYFLKKVSGDSNTLTLDGDGSETIDGSATWTTTTQYAGVTVMSDNTNWIILK